MTEQEPNIVQFAMDMCRLYLQAKEGKNYTNKRHQLDVMQAHHDALIGLVRRKLIDDYDLIKAHITVNGTKYVSNTITTKFVSVGKPVSI